MSSVASSTTDFSDDASPPSTGFYKNAMAKLTLIEQKNPDPTAVPPPKSFDLNGVVNKKILIGRGTSCDVTLSSLQISRRHAILEYRKGKWFIEDLSTNGITLQTPNNPTNLHQKLVKTVQTFLPSPSVIIHFVPGISYNFITSSPCNKTEEGEVQKENVKDSEESLLSIENNSQENNNSPSILILSATNNKRKSENNIEERNENKKSKKNDNEELQNKLKKLEAEVESLKLDRIIQREEMVRNQENEIGSRMAVMKNEMERKFVEAMESEFGCAVCAEVFIEPCTIECGHTVCHYCITEWLKKKPECPICRRPCRARTPSKHFEMDNYLAKVYAILGGEEMEKRGRRIKERAVEKQNQQQNQQAIPQQDLMMFAAMQQQLQLQQVQFPPQEAIQAHALRLLRQPARGTRRQGQRGARGRGVAAAAAAAQQAAAAAANNNGGGGLPGGAPPALVPPQPAVVVPAVQQQQGNMFAGLDFLQLNDFFQNIRRTRAAAAAGAIGGGNNEIIIE